MPTVRGMMDGLQAQIVTALSTVPGLVLTGPGQNVLVASGWPSIERLQAVPVSQISVINIYDHGQSKCTTRWMPCLSNEIDTPNNLTSTFDRTIINPGQSATFTLSSTTDPVTTGNAVSMLVSGGLMYAGEAVSAGSTDTLATMCTNLAAILGVNTQLVGWATFVASGATIVVTNITTVPLSLQSYTGSFSTYQMEVHREVRSLQVNLWAPDDPTRSLIGEVLNSLFATLTVHFGFQVGTEWVRVVYDGDMLLEDDIMRDVYRWMFLLSVELGTTMNELVYSVLVPIGTLEALRADTP